MKLGNLLKKFHVEKLKLNAKVLEMEIAIKDADKDAAWELYVELLTRTATQYLAPAHGDEAASLESIHKLFGLTREIIKRHGRKCTGFTKIAIVILNQIIRPFTAKWHRIAVADGFKKGSTCSAYRKELEIIQAYLREYACLLAHMANVEDFVKVCLEPIKD